jgi:hypothetical protein
MNENKYSPAINPLNTEIKNIMADLGKKVSQFPHGKAQYIEIGPSYVIKKH